MGILAGVCWFRLRRVAAHLCVVGVGCALVGTVAPVAALDVPVLDDSWGVDGELDSPFGDSPVHLVAGASGSLYVVEAEVVSGRVRVARLLSDGSLDTGFDSDGVVSIGAS